MRFSNYHVPDPHRAPLLMEKVVAVERIQAALDHALATRAVTWVCAPAGAGKSTQVAIHLRRRPCPHVWFAAGGADLERRLSLLLAEAAQLPAARRQAGVQLHRPLQALPNGCLLVLDDVDPSIPEQVALLQALIEQLPAGGRLIIISRSGIPACLERSVMDRRIGLLDAGVFQCRDTEMADVALSLGGTPVADDWLKLLEGWVGGLVLLPPGTASAGMAAGAGLAGAMRPIFGYLRAQVWANLDEADRSLLVRLACLPRLDAARARQLLQAPSGWDRLLGLAQRCLFIQEADDAAGPRALRLHPALRAFLREEGQTVLPAAALQALHHDCAVVLEDMGEAAEAADAYLLAGDSEGLAALLERRMRAGCEDVNGEWMRRLALLDGEMLRRHPWLQYWRGRTLVWSDPAGARAHFRAAADRFAEEVDEPGRLLAACAIVESGLMDRSEGAPLRADALVLEKLLRLGGVAPDALAHACLAAARGIADPRSADLGCLVHQAVKLSNTVTRRGEKLRVASKLLLCTPWLPQGYALALTMEFDKVALDNAQPLAERVEWCCVASQWHLQCGGDLDAAWALVETGTRLAIEGQLHMAHRCLEFVRAEILFAQGRCQEAGEVGARLWVSRDAVDQPDRDRSAAVKMQLLFAFGDVAAATAVAEATRNSKALSHRLVERSRFERLVASLCAGRGDFAQAALWSDRAIESSCGTEQPLATDMRLLLDLLGGEQGADIAQVREAAAGVLRRQRVRALDALFVQAPAVAAKAVQLALGGGADTVYAAAIVRRQQLAAPGRGSSQWPWPVVVRTFGGVTLLVNGVEQRTAGKAQQRLLDLLRILAAAGEAGRAQSFLETHLWPDSDSPKAALAVAVHRLRKLLGNDAAVIVHGGKVQLAQDLVWSDTDALTALCQEIDRLGATGAHADAEWYAAELLAIYRGSFCADGDDMWLVALGNKFYTRFAAAAEILGLLLEKRGDWAAAGRLYRRALDVETLCEFSYRGLMRCTHAQGDSAAAFGHYRFCRDTLSVLLNREPSAETKNLAVSLGFVAAPRAATMAA